MLPIKTGIEDIDAVTAYLRGQVGWVPIEKVRKAIPSVHADNRKIEAMRYIGLIERDGTNIKLTEAGREYAAETTSDGRGLVLARQMRSATLYQSTLEWMHFSKKDAPTKNDIGNYWHDHQGNLLEGAAGAALTDGAIFFLRLADAAGFGKFISAGRGRPETYLKVDSTALQAFIETAPVPAALTSAEHSQLPEQLPPKESSEALLDAHRRPAISAFSPAVHVNIEIHIAADAKASTVEEIFKNMRKYVLQSHDEF